MYCISIDHLLGGHDRHTSGPQDYPDGDCDDLGDGARAVGRPDCDPGEGYVEDDELLLSSCCANDVSPSADTADLEVCSFLVAARWPGCDST